MERAGDVQNPPGDRAWGGLAAASGSAGVLRVPTEVLGVAPWGQRGQGRVPRLPVGEL